MSGQDNSWKNLTMGAVCSKLSTTFLTGDWKTFEPKCDFEKCVNCLTCVLFCPEGAIQWKPDVKQIMFNLNFCKGCGICANECPIKIIVMKMPEKEE
jgi:2-oxoacid:acceptor oxidoreductase delta subunit (pyruvate/2-ketoisovalerate family)